MEIQIETNSAEESQKLAAAVGNKLRGGEVIELISDVGGGKTTFVRGLAQGAGSTDHVSSPTFMISKIYESKVIRIVHFDFYRLQEAGLIMQELEEALAESKNVIVVEWSDVARKVLPEERIAIRITKHGEDQRTMDITYPEKFAYLWESAQ